MIDSFDVIIVGAGPTGTTAATLLGQRGVRCLLLDRWEDVYPQPRAVHLDDEVYRILDDLGIGEEFAAISRPALGLRLLSPDHRVLAEFRRDGLSSRSGHPRANMFDQPELERLLRRNLASVPSVTFRGGVEVTRVRSATAGHEVDFRDTNSGEIASARGQFVLGCDGANSIVRDCIGGHYRDLRFQQRWLVIDVESSASLDQWEGIHQVCDSRRAATFMQIGPTRYRWEFQLREGETSTSFTDLYAVIPLISPWLPTNGADQLELIRVAEYTFRAQIADKWSEDGVFLLGDAAHLTPPFIGQGMGAGLRDAHNLAWKIAGVLDHSLPVSVL
ncbi:MAG: bifunctional 3-(3-hydroxy-phenyl)propionate/3-hydroxycinnamic acid hydroxylase, partial [Marmoricola sp.]